MHIYTRVQNRQGNVQKQTFIRFEASTKRFLIERFPRAHTLPSCNAWEMKENALNETGNFLFSSPFRLLLLLLWNSFHTLRYPADTKLLSSLNLFCACFVSWRSSVSRLHTFIIFIFPLFGVRNTYTAFAFLMWRFLKFFFFICNNTLRHATITSKISTIASFLYCFVRQIAHYKTISRC